MIKEIIKYPDPEIFQLSGLIRYFDDDLNSLINDLKETAKHRNLEILTALQIGIPKKVMVYKNENDDFIELINPTIFKQDGIKQTKERCDSIDNLEVQTDRYESIKVMYQDKNGKQRFLDAKGKVSINLQRAINMLFGELLIDRVDKKTKKKFDKQNSNEAAGLCPSRSFRDIVLSLVRITVIFEFILFLLHFIFDFVKHIYQYTAYFTMFGFLVLAVYFFVAQYETRKYKNCTSCQTANSMGNILGYGAILIIFYIIFII